jgi:uncharacterized protein
MKLEEIRARLDAHAERIRSDLGIVSLSVFGSVARGQTTAASDIDVLVEFSGEADFDRFMELKERLEGLLGMRVDLVTTKALRPELRPGVEGEAIRVA